jgi:hypothetical protein
LPLWVAERSLPSGAALIQSRRWNPSGGLPSASNEA